MLCLLSSSSRVISFISSLLFFFFLLLYAYPRLLRPSLFRNAALIFHFPTELVDLEITDCTKTSGRGKVGLGPGGGEGILKSLVHALSFWNDQKCMPVRNTLRLRRCVVVVIITVVWYIQYADFPARPLDSGTVRGVAWLLSSTQRFFFFFLHFSLPPTRGGGTDPPGPSFQTSRPVPFPPSFPIPFRSGMG